MTPSTRDKARMRAPSGSCATSTCHCPPIASGAMTARENASANSCLSRATAAGVQYRKLLTRRHAGGPAAAGWRMSRSTAGSAKVLTKPTVMPRTALRVSVRSECRARSPQMRSSELSACVCTCSSSPRGTTHATLAQNLAWSSFDGLGSIWAIGSTVQVAIPDGAPEPKRPTVGYMPMWKFDPDDDGSLREAVRDAVAFLQRVAEGPAQ
jgi:hypothetical protein